LPGITCLLQGDVVAAAALIEPIDVPLLAVELGPTLHSNHLVRGRGGGGGLRLRLRVWLGLRSGLRLRLGLGPRPRLGLGLGLGV